MSLRLKNYLRKFSPPQRFELRSLEPKASVLPMRFQDKYFSTKKKLEFTRLRKLSWNSPDRVVVSDDTARLCSVFVNLDGLVCQVGQFHPLLLHVQQVRVRVQVVESDEQNICMSLRSTFDV